MQLDKFDQLVVFRIWQPRYHDKVVLLKKSLVDKAKTEHLKIVFTKAPSMAGDWYISRSVAKKCPVESNGVTQVYAVKLDKLTPLEVTKESKYV
jgi:hypothetical protein